MLNKYVQDDNIEQKNTYGSRDKRQKEEPESNTKPDVNCFGAMLHLDSSHHVR